MKLSGGLKDQGIVVGNTYDKYGSRNPVVRWIMRGFESTLFELVNKAEPRTIHEVGCGEGYWVLSWNEMGFQVRGTDFSEAVVQLARDNARQEGVDADLFEARSVYELIPRQDDADLVVCCEVLEHLESPETALKTLGQVATGKVILSVPREPIWRLLNMARGKYLSSLGNTPGHLQHWSRSAFVQLVGQYFDVVEVRSPLPWTMVLAQSRN